MQKPYARSTLVKKYRATGINTHIIDMVKTYLDACANFYYLLEMDEAFKIITRDVEVTREQFDSLLTLLTRDDDLDGYIIPESEMYEDGDDTLLILSKYYLTVDNKECDIGDFIDKMDDPDVDVSSLPPPFAEDWDRFYPLYEARAGKTLFVPDDLPMYANEEYYESTPQTAALERFLEPRLKKPGNIDTITDAEYKTYLVHALVMEILEIIKDPTIMPTQGVSKAIETVNAIVDRKMGEKAANQFVDLYLNLSNHTRFPSNKGYTPNELSALLPKGGPTTISFGPGIQESIRNGDLDADEFRQAIFAQTDLPAGLRGNILSEIDKAALKPGEEKWVGETVFKGAKVGPNDPCPCGSGKKYKKCCGRG